MHALSHYRSQNLFKTSVVQSDIRGTVMCWGTSCPLTPVCHREVSMLRHILRRTALLTNPGGDTVKAISLTSL